jgi:hypothetical protein
MSERAGEERPCRSGIAAFGDQHIDDLAVLVDRPVQVGPASGDLDVSSSTNQRSSAQSGTRLAAFGVPRPFTGSLHRSQSGQQDHHSWPVARPAHVLIIGSSCITRANRSAARAHRSAVRTYGPHAGPIVGSGWSYLPRQVSDQGQAHRRGDWGARSPNRVRRSRARSAQRRRHSARLSAWRDCGGRRELLVCRFWPGCGCADASRVVTQPETLSEPGSRLQCGSVGILVRRGDGVVQAGPQLAGVQPLGRACGCS